MGTFVAPGEMPAHEHAETKAAGCWARYDDTAVGVGEAYGPTVATVLPPLDSV